MLDRKTTSVLNIINNISDGSFKCIDADDIIGKLPNDVKPAKAELNAIIKNLADHEIIAIKYATMDEYCLAALPKARLVEEKVQEVEAKALQKGEKEGEVSVSEVSKDLPTLEIENMITPVQQSAPDLGLIKKMVRKAAFIGAAMGGALVALVSFILGLILRK